jgi:hypothetical protein
MKIKNDVVLQALKTLATAPKEPGADTKVPFPALVAAIREATGIEVPNTPIREALREVEKAGDCTIDDTGRAWTVTYVSPETRAVWTKADNLATQLGGLAEKRVGAGDAVIILSLAAAEALVTKVK